MAHFTPIKFIIIVVPQITADYKKYHCGCQSKIVPSRGLTGIVSY